MVKEEFEQRVLEQQIFNDLKDASIWSSEYVRKKYQGLNIDYSRLYRRIINYQIKTYGTSLNDRSFPTEDYEKRKNRINNRKRQRRITNGIR